MLLLFPKLAAEEITTYSILAVNLHTYDEINIVKNDETGLFSLQVAKMCNPHVTQSAFVSQIGVFQTSAGCLNLFQSIVETLESGDQTFELPMPELPVSDQVDSSQNVRANLGYN